MNGDPTSGAEHGVPSALLSTEVQLRSVAAYLSELNGLQFPPVRNVHAYNDLLLDASRLVDDLPGVRFDPLGPAWLVVELSGPPIEPNPPRALTDVLTPRLLPHARPLLRVDLELSAAERESLVQTFDEWMTSEWEPWDTASRRRDLGRKLYLDLFSAYERLGVDRESIELVWGFGRVRWKAFDIDHPLVLVPMEITYDAAMARLSVSQSGAAEVGTRFLTGVALVAPEQLNTATKSLEAVGFDPWEPNFVKERLTPLLRMISNDSPVEGGPTLEAEWLLYVRRRPSGYLDFLESFDENLGSLAELAPLAALVAADPYQVEPRDAAATMSERILLPLPANEEQRQILSFATSAAGVTVEGPPGTGKSHTIANLICAFIAEGQRVLVTAEKEQALNVLIDKLPEAVRPLCVPVLGSDQQARLRLEHSLDRISQSAFGLSQYDAAAISRLENVLAENRRAEAAALNEMRWHRDAERSSLPPEATLECGATLAELGAWLHASESDLGYIPDRIALGTTCPLGPDELAELAALLAEIPESDEAAALLSLPEIGKLPGAADLITEASERKRLFALIDDFDLDVDSAVTPSEGLPELHDLADRLRLAADRSERLDGRWQGQLERAVRDDAAQEMWRSFARQLDQGRGAVMALRAQLQAHEISLPSSGTLDHDAIEELKEARARLDQKGRLRLSQRRAQRILEQCKVDGHVPRTAEEVGLVLAASELLRSRALLAHLLASEQLALGLSLASVDRPEEIASALLPDLNAILEWRTSTWPELRGRVAAAGVRIPADLDTASVMRIGAAIDAVAARLRVKDLDAERVRLLTYLAGSSNPRQSPLTGELERALREQDWEAWGRTCLEVRRLAGLAVGAGRIQALLAQLSFAATEWARSARASDGVSLGHAQLLDSAWRWRRLATWFDFATAGREPSEIESELRRLATQRSRLQAELVAARAWTAVVRRIDGPTQLALGAYKNANARLGKGFSKFASTYQRQVRASLDGCRHAVPVWIMPVERVLADFRCENTPPFDVLVIDEASQIPISRLPVLGLARRVIIVGDDKQMSPSNPGFELQPAFDLAKKHLANVPKGDVKFFVNASLYDVALTCFPRKVQLTEHFRCLTEIISFSNSRYYENRLVPLRDELPSPGWVPTHSVLVVDGYRDDDDCNRPEADYAAALVAALIKRAEYAGKTFGVISLLGKNQSKLIHDLLFDRLGPVVMAERRIRVGEPAVLQGDERDVVIISTVVSDAGGRRLSAMTRRDHQQMINVAASRARDQLWVLHSVPANAFPRNDERAELILHCSQVKGAAQTFDRLEELIDDRSPLERDILRALVGRGYRTIRPQHRVGRYEIDFVIEGPHTRLALECDGDRFHGPEQWDADRARQDVLERAGWTFVRVRGSSFYRDPERALQPLWNKLDEMGISPGDWREAPPNLDLELELLVRTPAPTIAETAPGKIRNEKETEPPGSAGPSLANVPDPPQDPWGVAFNAADEALRRRTSAMESPQVPDVE